MPLTLALRLPFLLSRPSGPCDHPPLALSPHAVHQTQGVTPTLWPQQQRGLQVAATGVREANTAKEGIPGQVVS